MGTTAVAIGSSSTLAADEPIVWADDYYCGISFQGSTWKIRKDWFDEAIGAGEMRADPAAKTISLADRNYPGTRLNAGFRLQLSLDGASWRIAIEQAEASQKNSFPLADWIQGNSGTVEFPLGAFSRPRILNLPALRRDDDPNVSWFKIPPCSMYLRADFSIRLEADTDEAFKYHVGSRYHGLTATTASVVIGLSDPPASSSGRKVATRFSLKLAGLEPLVVKVGKINTGMQAEVEFYGAELEIRAYRDRKDAGRAFVEVLSPDAALAVKWSDEPADVSRVQFRRRDSTLVSLSFDAFGFESLMRFSGCLSSHPFGLEARSWSAVIAGLGTDPPVTLDFVNSSLPEIDLRVNVCSLHVPIDKGAVANINFSPNSGRLIVRPHRPEDFGSEVQAPLLWIGAKDATLETGLDDARMRVRRAGDLLDLSFGFGHHALSCSSAEGTEIWRRALQITKTAPAPSPRVTIYFPPQHIFEEAFLPAVDNVAVAQEQRRDISKPGMALTRISEPSRLVFEDRTSPHWGVREPLTVQFLTQWTDKALVLNKRALARNSSIEDQLQASGICGIMGPDEYQRAWRTFHQPPAKEETAIEAVYRLLLSPDCLTKFEWSRSEARDGAIPVSSLRVANPDVAAFRALWSRGMRKYPVDTAGLIQLRDRESHEPRFTGSLSGDDRVEIVGLTSFFGIVALRRKTKTLGGLEIDDPKGMVVRPEGGDYNKLLGLDGEYGFMLAKPFDQFELTLSRSGSLRAKWNGDPPAYNPNLFVQGAYTIERYVHRIQDGRDAHVEVLYKGFLLPFGHRAALLKLTQREFHPFQKNADGSPVAYLIQHYYIVCNRPKKNYPAYNHPFDGNDFPPRAVELLTTVSPEIQMPSRFPDGLTLTGVRFAGAPSQEGDSDISEGDDSPIRVFWPKLLTKPADAVHDDVLFNFKIDDALTPARAPLLFVDNAAAHIDEVMKQVVKYYNALKDDDISKVDELYRRTVTHPGTPLRYAPETRDSECTFPTSSWQMGIHGCFTGGPSPQAGTEAYSFRMDSMMEGADQPPAYPFVDEAKITVKSVNQLTGKLNQEIAVGYSGQYVQHAFDKASNSSEIFLEVRNPQIFLDVSDDSRSTGGVAKPNVLLSALSRSLGPVGGRGLSPSPNSRDVVPSPNASSPHAAALSGRFDPSEYFGGLLKDAKLLGVVSLKDILQAAGIDKSPKLVSQTLYNAQQAAKNVADSVSLALKGIASEVLPLFEKLDGKAQSTLRPLYPEFFEAWDQLSADLKEIRDSNSLQLDQEEQLASAVLNHGQRVVTELQKIADNPLPANVDQLKQELSQLWDEISGVSRDPSGLLRSWLKEELENEVIKPTRDLLDSTFSNGYFEAAFGAMNFSGPATPLLGGPSRSSVILQGKPAPVQLAQFNGAPQPTLREFILSDPDEALPNLEHSLFCDSLGRPVARSIQAINALQVLLGEDVLGQRVVWSRRMLARKLAELLCAGQTVVLDAAVEAGWKIVGIVEKSWRDCALVALDKVEAALDVLKQAIAQEAAPIQSAVDEFRVQLNEELSATRCEIEMYRDAAKSALVAGDQNQYYDDILLAQEAAARYDVLCIIDSQLAAKPASPNFVITFLQEEVAALVREAWTEARDALLAAGKSGVDSAIACISTVARAFVEQAIEGVVVGATAQVAAAVQSSEEYRAAVVSATMGPLSAIDSRIADLSAKLDVALVALRVAIRDAHNADNGKNELAFQNLEGKAATASAAAQRLVRDASDLNAIAADIAVTWKDALPLTSTLGEVLAPVGRAVDLRVRIADDATNLLVQLTAVGESAKSTSTNLSGNLDKVSESVVALVQVCGMFEIYRDLTLRTAIEKVAGPVGVLKHLHFELNDAIKEANALAERFVPSLKPDQAAALCADALDFARNRDRKVAGLLLQALLKDAAPLASGEFFIRPLVSIAKTISTIDDTAKALLDKLAAAIETSTVLKQVLAENVQDQLSARRKALDSELTVLTALQQGDPNNLSVQGQALIAMWKAAPPAAAGALIFLKNIVGAIASGNIRDIFDPDAILAILRERLAELIPSRIKLNYDFDAELPDFPSGNPIFLIDRSNEDVGKYANDLVINTEVQIDLLSNTRTVASHGRVRPFKIHLLGNSPDLATIYFSGATFDLAAGGSPKFNAEVSGLEIGKAMMFLQSLATLAGAAVDAEAGDDPEENEDTTPEAESGIFFRRQSNPPEIEIGYRYNKPLIDIGALIFQNVGFSISAFLPFDDRTGEFRVSFASPQQPLIVSGQLPTPYAGAGAVGVRAHASGFIATEIQLEFGAALAYHFGPLQASGRLTAGIYMLSYGGSRRLEGFVHFEGEGHIACFGVSTLIEIRTVHTEGGAMEGSATYQYKFSLGLTDVSFSVTAHHSVQGGGAGNGGNDQARVFLAPLALCEPLTVRPGPRRFTVSNRAPSKMKNWAAYSGKMNI